MPSKGINRDGIASRAELWSKYGRPSPQYPITAGLEGVAPPLAPLAGVDVLKKSDSDQVGEHARSPV